MCPIISVAQSEEDILNSIGAELEAEEDKQKKEEELQKQYDDLKSKADGYLKSEKFDKAEPLYKEMSELMPDNDYPKRQLRLIDQKIAEAKAAEKQAKYDKLVAEADALMGKEKWDEAAAKYKEASAVIPDESYPKGKVKEIADLKAAKAKAEQEAKIQAEYDKFIQQADGALSSEQWDVAKQNYQSASKVKPAETYPKDQLQKVAKLEAEAKEKAKQEAIDKQYNALIAEADKLLNSKSWDAAKEKYTAAQKVKPTESYPKDQIAKADQLKAEEADKAKQEAIDKQYNALIAEADKLLASKSWDAAVTKYEEAKKVKADPYPEQKITEAKNAKKAEADAAAQAEVDANYQAVINEADALYKSKDWDGAITKYKEAQGIKSGESYPGEQITAAQNAKKAEADAAAQAEVDANYQAAISEADVLYKSKDWDGAIAKYKEAQGIKAGESYPGEQITAAQNAKKAEADAAAQAEVDANYQAAISEADALYKSKDWDGAIAKYREAQGIKSGESYPGEQISAAQNAKKAEADAAAQAEKQAQYDALISDADALFNESKWNEAVSKYKEASSVLPDEKYPSAQISKAESNLKSEQDAAAAASELEANYTAAISAGITAFSASQWDEAIAKFKEAQKLKPDATEPADLIDKTEKAKSEAEANAEAAAKAQAEEAKLEEAYNKLISEADAAKAAQKYQEAQSKFNEALALKPSEAYPAQQIDEIDQILTEAAEAKAAKEAATAELEANYQKAMSDCETALNAGDLGLAKTSFETAIGLKPDEKDPQKKLKEVEKLIAEKQEEEAKQAEAAAAAAQLDEQYNTLIKQADDARDNKRYDDAKSFYKEASNIKPDETYPKDQLVNLQALIENDKQAKLELENQYSGLMSEGESALRDKNWEGARSAFKKAIELKPEAMGAKERLEEVDRLEELNRIEEEKAAEEARKAAEKENEFKSTIEMGDAAFNAENYEEAIGHYERGLELMPSDGYTRDQLRQANDLLTKQKEAEEAARLEAERLAAEEAARKKAEEEARRKAEEEARRKAAEEAKRQAEIQQQFDEAMGLGDQAMSVGNFKMAAEQYGIATNLKPENAEAANKFSEADVKNKEREAANAEKRRREEAKRRRELEEARRKAAEEAERRRQERIKRLKENTPEELAKRYPNGITNETIDQGYRVITRSVIVENGRGRLVQRIDYPWGLKFFYINGKRVTSDAYYHDIRNYQNGSY